MKPIVRALRICLTIRNGLCVVGSIGGLISIFSTSWSASYIFGFWVLFYALGLIALTSFIIFLQKNMIKTIQQCEATRADWNASSALTAWRVENQKKDWHDPVGQKLVRRAIKARKHWNKINRPLKPDEKHIDYLRTFLQH